MTRPKRYTYDREIGGAKCDPLGEFYRVADVDPLIVELEAACRDAHASSQHALTVEQLERFRQTERAQLRAVFATSAMNGMLVAIPHDQHIWKNIAAWAVQQADALLAELDKDQQPSNPVVVP